MSAFHIDCIRKIKFIRNSSFEYEPNDFFFFCLFLHNWPITHWERPIPPPLPKRKEFRAMVWEIIWRRSGNRLGMLSCCIGKPLERVSQHENGENGENGGRVGEKEGNLSEIATAISVYNHSIFFFHQSEEICYFLSGNRNFFFIFFRRMTPYRSEQSRRP